MQYSIHDNYILCYRIFTYKRQTETITLYFYFRLEVSDIPSWISHKEAIGVSRTRLTSKQYVDHLNYWYLIIHKPFSLTWVVVLLLSVPLLSFRRSCVECLWADFGDGFVFFVCKEVDANFWKKRELKFLTNAVSPDTAKALSVSECHWTEFRGKLKLWGEMILCFIGWNFLSWKGT